MRIGMVSATYDPTVLNGVLRMVSLYKQHLEARGHEVLIFTLGEAAEGDADHGIIRSPGLRLGDYGYYISMGYTRQAQQLLAQMDIVHSHHLFMSVEMAHRYAHCPVVYTNHTRYDLYTGAYTPLPQGAADAIMRQVWPDFTDLADTVIAPAESVRHVMIDFGVRSPIVVIPNGIELERFARPSAPYHKIDLGWPPDALALAYVGRLAEEKNIAGLLRQFAAARARNPRLRLSIIGQGPQEADLHQLATALDLDESVRFTGAVPFDDVPNVLAAADAFVTASTSEVHPLTIIEAMAAGKPVAAVTSPGVSEIIVDGVTGCLAESEDGLCEAILGVTGDPIRLIQMGATAAESSHRFDIRYTIDLTLRLYERLLADRPDLRRRKEHGRWSRRTEMWAPLVDQLASLVKPPHSGDGARGRHKT